MFNTTAYHKLILKQESYYKEFTEVKERLWLVYEKVDHTERKTLFYGRG